MGQFGAAEATQDLLVRGVTVIHDDVVVRALLVGLQLELREQQLDPVARRGGEDPNTLLQITLSQPNSLVVSVKHLTSRQVFPPGYLVLLRTTVLPYMFLYDLCNSVQIVSAGANICGHYVLAAVHQQIVYKHQFCHP